MYALNLGQRYLEVQFLCQKLESNIRPNPTYFILELISSYGRDRELILSSAFGQID